MWFELEPTGAITVLPRESLNGPRGGREEEEEERRNKAIDNESIKKAENNGSDDSPKHQPVD